MMISRPAKQTGLTLLEVMVALAIFAVAGTAILKSAGDSLNSLGQIEEVTMANWVANNQLVRIQLAQTWPLTNNRRGTVEMADRTWYWWQSVSATNDDDLKAVTLQVGRDPQYQDSITSVTAYFTKPTETN